MKSSFMEKTYVWTYKIISSCHYDFHFDCADALIFLFGQKYGENNQLYQLKQLREHKWLSAHGVKNELV